MAMVNNLSSSCPNCMTLLRLLVLNNLKHDRRVFVKYISSKANYLADSLSRLDFDRFRRLGGNKMNDYPNKVSALIWLLDKIWAGLRR